MRSFAKLALLGLLVTAAACGGDGPSAPTSIAGTYNLQTIDGDEPPVTVWDEPGLKIEIISGNFVLAANETFTTTVNLRETSDGQVQTDSETLSGTYSVSGSTVTFVLADGDSETATIAGDTLTFTDGESSVVFRKVS
jgi:hypothetical protein